MAWKILSADQGGLICQIAYFIAPYQVNFSLYQPDIKMCNRIIFQIVLLHQNLLMTALKCIKWIISKDATPPPPYKINQTKVGAVNTSSYYQKPSTHVSVINVGHDPITNSRCLPAYALHYNNNTDITTTSKCGKMLLTRILEEFRAPEATKGQPVPIIQLE